MAEKKYYYLYETTNLTNGKKYVGQHCTRNLDDGYFGSCKELIADSKRGHVLSVKILEFFEGVTQLGDAEYEYIKKHGLIQNENYYNKINFFYHNWNFEKGLGDETRKKVSENNGMKNPEVRKKVSEALKRKYRDDTEYRKKVSENNGMKKPGANNPMKNPEVRKKVSENNGMKNPEVRKKVSETLKLYYANKKSKQEKS